MKKKKLEVDVFSIKLHREERAVLEQAALLSGRKLGAYIRHCALLNALWAVEENDLGVELSRELAALKLNNESVFEALREHVKGKTKKAS